MTSLLTAGRGRAGPFEADRWGSWTSLCTASRRDQTRAGSHNKLHPKTQRQKRGRCKKDDWQWSIDNLGESVKVGQHGMDEERVWRMNLVTVVVGKLLQDRWVWKYRRVRAWPQTEKWTSDWRAVSLFPQKPTSPPEPNCLGDQPVRHFTGNENGNKLILLVQRFTSTFSLSTTGECTLPQNLFFLSFLFLIFLPYRQNN